MLTNVDPNTDNTDIKNPNLNTRIFQNISKMSITFNNNSSSTNSHANTTYSHAETSTTDAILLFILILERALGVGPDAIRTHAQTSDVLQCFEASEV